MSNSIAKDACNINMGFAANRIYAYTVTAISDSASAEHLHYAYTQLDSPAAVRSIFFMVRDTIIR